MSRTIEPTGEPIDVPSKDEIERHMNELEQRGVTTELQCGECNDLTETTVLPEEAGDENQKTLCRSCTEAFLLE